jgi:hypothetical protein
MMTFCINAITQVQQEFLSQSDIPGSMVPCTNSHCTPNIWSESACKNLLQSYDTSTCTGDTPSHEHQPWWGDEEVRHLPCQIHVPALHSLWEEPTGLYQVFLATSKVTKLWRLLLRVRNFLSTEKIYPQQRCLTWRDISRVIWHISTVIS